MDIADNHYCFICGRDNPVGFRTVIDVDPQTRSASCTVVVPKEYQGWQGMVHGGIISALLDEVCAYAGMTVAETVVTGELKTRYRKPVPVEHEVTATARVVDQVRRTVLVEGQLTAEGEILAIAEARMVVVRASSS